MSSWDTLDRELAAWSEAGAVATLWWRDDDAISDTPALRRLLATAADLPLSLAVIPAAAEPSLAPALSATPAVTALQHGYAHVNHARPHAKKAELGAGRPIETILDELRDGMVRLGELFGSHALPVLVPPWNRIAPEVVLALPRLGFRGLSCYGARKGSQAGLARVNTHVDLIDWHGTRGFVGTERALDLLVDHLRARRTGAADSSEPTGLLSHHLTHDEATWVFLGKLREHLRSHAAVRWVGAREAFGLIAGQDAAR